MNPNDLFASLEGGVLPANILDALWAQESSRGKNMLNQSSGAAGHFQLIPGNYQAAGIDPNDLAASAKWTADYARKALERFPDMDPVDAIASHHFAGPNTKIWGPKTRQYAADIRRRMGQSSNQTGGETVSFPQFDPAAMAGTTVPVSAHPQYGQTAGMMGAPGVMPALPQQGMQARLNDPRFLLNIAANMSPNVGPMAALAQGVVAAGQMDERRRRLFEQQIYRNQLLMDKREDRAMRREDRDLQHQMRQEQRASRLDQEQRLEQARGTVADSLRRQGRADEALLVEQGAADKNLLALVQQPEGPDYSKHIGTISPESHTTESIEAFRRSGDFRDLVKIPKKADLDAAKVARDVHQTVRNIREFEKLVNEKGTEYVGENLSTLNFLRGQILAAVGEARNLGVVDQNEYERLEAQFPDPTTLGGNMKAFLPWIDEVKSILTPYQKFAEQLQFRHGVEVPEDEDEKGNDKTGNNKLDLGDGFSIGGV